MSRDPFRFDPKSELLSLILQVYTARVGLQTPVYGTNQQQLFSKNLMSFEKASVMVANENHSH